MGRNTKPRGVKGANTRLTLVAAARKLFGEQGYHATGTYDVVALAGVTRGALYYHFPDKESLFFAVFEAVERDLIKGASPDAADPGRDHWAYFQQGLQAYLSTIVDSGELRQILLLDGPAVFGWSRWRQLQVDYGVGAIVTALEAAMAQGLIQRQPPRPLAHVLLAAIDEAALLIVNSDNPTQSRDEMSVALSSLIQGLQ